jgi:hypothetical protein
MQLVIFLLAWFIFTFGPGIAITGRLTRDLDALRGVIVALGVGSAAAPLLIDILGRLHLVPLFPYLAVALAAFGLWLSRRPADAAVGSTNDGAASWGDLAACIALVGLAVGLGTIVFAHRLDSTAAGISINGDYDTVDLSIYAAAAAEASHTVPPTAAYYSGHQLNAAYYPQLVPAMIHRFARVPILPMYFGYAWPTFLSLSALCAFILVRSLASPAVATLAVVLALVGSDLSYLAAWLLPQTSDNWDYVLWPTNFLSPTMQLLHFSTWGPSLPVFFTALYSIVRGLQTRARSWIVISAFLLGVLFEFKPFAYVILTGALAAATVFSGRDRLARLHFSGTAALGVVFALPSLFRAATLDPGDRRSRLVFEFLPLVKRMLIKLGLDESFPDWVGSIVPWAPVRTPAVLLLASIIFFAIGIGVRWVGMPGVWRAIRRRPVADTAQTVSDVSAWSLLGWAVLTSIAIPLVIATEPYVDTLQFYVPCLFLLWIFTAVALVRFAGRHPRAGVAAVLMAIALTLPSSAHYLERRWTDRQRTARVDLSTAEIRIAEYLRNKTDPETTVILHDRPLSPSLITILAERRIVLGWDITYSAVGGQDRLRDVNRFFSSADGNADAAFESLGRYHVTHVIVRDDDRVHPAVLARLHRLMQFPGAALYTVSQPAEP